MTLPTHNEMKTIAIIGCGNMGSAIAASLADTDYHVICTSATQKTLDSIKSSFPKISTTLNNIEATLDADIIVLAVKPYVAPGVIEEIKASRKPGATIISVIAGLSIKALSDAFGEGCRNSDLDSKPSYFFRVIPNTAIRNKKSVTFISHEADTPDDKTDEISAIFNLSGKTYDIPESQMGICTALASCGIAYFLRFIRALSEGSVELGLKAGFATEIAALTAEGAASLLAEGSHPEVEIDKVTTPGGITIKGLNALEANGFTNAVIAALKASV